MANIKLSELPTASSVAATDFVELSQGAGPYTSSKATVAQLATQVGFGAGDILTTARTLSTPTWLSSGQAYLSADYPAVAPLFPADAGYWTPVTSGFDALWIYAVASGSSGVWIAGGQSGVMTRSTDNGLSWNAVTSGFSTAQSILAVATDGSGVWVAVGGKTSSTTSSYMARSTDNGATWMEVTSGFGANPIYSVATNGTGTWMAGGSNGVMARSTDNGATWSSVTSPFGSFNTVRSIAAGASNVWVAVGGYELGGANTSVARSTDSGATWTASSTNTNIYYTVATDGAGTWIIGSPGYTPLISQNNAVSYTTVATLGNIRAIVSDKAGKWAAVGSGVGIKRSLNSGVSFTNGTLVTYPATTTFLSVATNGSGVYLAVGEGGRMARSSASGSLYIPENTSASSYNIYVRSGA